MHQGNEQHEEDKNQVHEQHDEMKSKLQNGMKHEHHEGMKHAQHEGHGPSAGKDHDDHHTHMLEDFRRKFVVSSILTIPVAAFSYHPGVFRL